MMSRNIEFFRVFGLETATYEIKSSLKCGVKREISDSYLGVFVCQVESVTGALILN